MRSFARTFAGFAAGASLAILTACTQSKQTEQAAPAQPATKIAPPTPIQTKRVELGGPTWDSNWDGVVERALPPAMLSSRVPRDVRQFCPRFYQMSDLDKRAFWAYFFQALAAAEAGLNATANVRHTEPEVSVRDAVTGRLVRSEGLLQLAYEDKERYGCDFDWRGDSKLRRDDPAKTILQPETNLKCGVKILSTQIIQHRKPLLSRTGYWSTLHPGTPDFVVFSGQMTNPPGACGRRTTRARIPSNSPRRPSKSRETAGAQGEEKKQ